MPNIRPEEYGFDEGEIGPEKRLELLAERKSKRLELLEYHNQTTYTDSPVKPVAPSYI